MSYSFYITDRSECITFSSRSKILCEYYLSNYVDFPVTIILQSNLSFVFPTAEHAIQASKFYVNGDYIYASLFTSKELTSEDAKKLGKRKRLTDEQLKKWESCCYEIQLQLCQHKVNSIPGLKEFLLSSKGKYLLHLELYGTWPKDGGSFLYYSPFGDNKLWLKGDNLLGKVWMQIRDSL